jgi:hypothetical protein
VVTVGSADDPRCLTPDTPCLLARALAPALGGAWVWREVAWGSPREIQLVAHALEQGDALELFLLVLLGELRVLGGALDPQPGQNPLELVGLRDVTSATGAWQHLADVYLLMAQGGPFLQEGRVFLARPLISAR